MANLDTVVRKLKSERARVAGELAKLDSAISALTGMSSHGASRGGKRVMSASARRRIAAAQKVRWAKWRKTQKAA